MKTPQQIRNEVEKERKRLNYFYETLQDNSLLTSEEKEELSNLLDYSEEYLREQLEDKEDYEMNVSYIGEAIDNLINIKDAKLSILTEYDKSIKEMIENWFNKLEKVYDEDEIEGKFLNRNKLNELLTKIGDVQQSQEEKNETHNRIEERD